MQYDGVRRGDLPHSRNLKSSGTNELDYMDSLFQSQMSSATKDAMDSARGAKNKISIDARSTSPRNRRERIFQETAL